MEYKPKNCLSCGLEFVPANGSQKRHFECANNHRKNYIKNYWYDNQDKYKEILRVNSKKRSEYLNETYITNQLKQQNIPTTPETIDQRRLTILISRIKKEVKTLNKN